MRGPRARAPVPRGAPRVAMSVGPSKSRRVRWIGGSAPVGAEARAVYEAVVERGLTDLADVERHVADLLYRDDVDHGGWITDIGLFRSLYVREARSVLERLDGQVVQLEEGKWA